MDGDFNPSGITWAMENKTYEGKICKKCETNAKYIKGRACVYCAKLSARKKYWSHPEDIKTLKRKRYKNNPDTNKDLKLRRAYGISLEDYNIILKQQNSVCAICENVCVSGRMLSVDHSHKTGKVRGLLCINCNRAIGNLKDDLKLLNRMKKYLKGILYE